jgi:Mrp family chromosome partitioning ATPase
VIRRRKAQEQARVKESACQTDPAAISFPNEVVQPLRRLVSRLALRGELPARLSMVSALRQEGVSYIAMALATTMAHDLAASVCAVELNWCWPGMAGERSGACPGLAALLAGGVPLEVALLPTSLPNLMLLPAGKLLPERRSVMANRPELRRIIMQLAERFDYVLLDVPALLATSDAIPLAALGEACCFVVRQGVTPAQSVRQALDDVEHMPVMGVVLNQVHVATPRWLLKLIPPA